MKCESCEDKQFINWVDPVTRKITRLRCEECMPKGYTVTVEIPELVDGECDPFCKFSPGFGNCECGLKARFWSVTKFRKRYKPIPNNPNCPRYEGGK